MIRLSPLLLVGCIVGALLAQQAPQSGEALFFGKAACASCHEVNGRGGIVGPDLSTAGRLSADALRQKIVDPSANPNPGGRGGPSTMVARTKDGKEIRGIRRAEDTFSLLITDTSGKLLRLDKRDLASATVEQKSLMPADFAQRLSEPEIQSLVAYLRTQTARNLSADIPGGVTYDRLRNAAAEPQNWLTYWGDYQGRHYSALKQIDTTNVRELQARWAVQLPNNSLLEATPIVVDGIMYTSGAPGQVFALDAKTGLQLWRYQRQQKVVNPSEINRYSRGVSVLGNRLFLGTLDAALVALDARTGQLLWETQVADTMLGYSITSPPLALKDKIVTGVTGGEFGANGFIDAYDPATGKRLWRFNTIPAAGEFGHDTWKGDSWQHGGGPAWLTGSYDADSDTLYWTVGNPGPDWDANVRAGDNLFTCSVIALDPNTGRRKWHYQFTPNDSHDWDSTEDVILVDRVFQGQPRKLLLHADRNGMFYVLDRTDGKLLLGKAVRAPDLEHGLRRERPAEDRTELRLAARGQHSRVSIGGRGDQFPGAVVQSGHGLAVSDDGRFRPALHPHAVRISGREAVRERRSARIGRARHRRDQSARSRDRRCEVDVPGQPRIARGRSARDGWRSRLRRDPRRQPDRPKRPHRSRVMALPNRRNHRRIANELRSGRQTIHRNLGRGSALQFRAARLNRN